MQDVNNHVVNKYHIHFGAAECKTIKKRKGKEYPKPKTKH